MATTASMHKHKPTTLGRIKCFIAKGTLSKNPLQQNKTCDGIPSFVKHVYSDPITFSNLEKYKLPGINGSWQRYEIKEILEQSFIPANLGDKFGPIWSTHYLRVNFIIPKEMCGKEIHLRFHAGCEATIRDSSGEILGAFSPDFRNEYVISKKWDSTQPKELVFYLEMACNGMFGGGMNGENLSISPPDESFLYTLNHLDISVFHPEVFKLLMDIEVLYGMATELPDDDHKGYQAMYTANEMINLIIENEHKKASQIADSFFAEKNGMKAHTLIAMGHCHIDTAWLWRYDETIRKCTRSWYSQMQLMQDYPEFVFTCSQAQQFYWIKKYCPTIFSKIKEWVKKGKFVPVGGSWVEMDGLLPSGESFIRQFFYGQKFFVEEFGIKCKEFWLPDTFGYSGQFPQILKHVGIDRFLTQKLSWSMVNKFPHHNFIWEGIDGSQVLVHFPPGDSYTMTASVGEILKSVKNSQDKGRCNVGAYLFGHGDGGGGPTKGMLEKLKRMRDVDGLPKVELGTPDTLFEKLSQERDKLCKWVGELYLELHNGTYTTQAKIKWFNRKLEQFLMEVELQMAMAYSLRVISEEQLKQDMELVDKRWKRLLLNQFHDVIPGSCIELVAKDAWRIYQTVWHDLEELQTRFHQLLIGTGENLEKYDVTFNPLSWDVEMVICSSTATASNGNVVQHVTLSEEPFQESADSVQGRKLPHKFNAVFANLTASGYSPIVSVNPSHSVSVTKLNNKSFFKISNGLISLTVDTAGTGGLPIENLVMITDESDELSVFKPGTKPGNYVIFDDVPLFWDAWDTMPYHLETRKELECVDSTGPQIVALGPLFAAYKWSAKFGQGGSTFTRYTIMRANSRMLEYFLVIDWKESHKFLKVEFPLDLLAREATYEIQYGHLQRPTHINTSWDMAKFEVSGQKWMDISQSDKGVTFITDSKYGFHARDNVVQLSLLRSPKNPDGNCDMHKHFIHYAVLPHQGTFQKSGSIRKAYEFNFLGANDIPILKTGLDLSKTPMNNWVTTSNEAVILEAVKVGAALNGAICIRMYESFGGSAKTKINFGFTVTKIVECNGLEEPLDPSNNLIDPNGNNSFNVTLSPFQVKTFLVHV